MEAPAPESAETSSPLRSPPSLPSLPPPLPSPPSVVPRILNAGTAWAMLGCIIGAQAIAAALVTVPWVVSKSLAEDKFDPSHPELWADARFYGWVMLSSFIGSGLVLLMLGRILVGPQRRDASSTGAAWILGTGQWQRLGFLTGSLFAILYCTVDLMVLRENQVQVSTPMTLLVSSKGFPQFAFIAVALFLAPPVEELLFRGVFFGGLAYSWGRTWAASITTLAFVAMHLSELMHQWSGTFAIGGLAVIALVLRLRSQSIGPSIAAHFGYNLVTVLVGIL